MLPLVWLMPTSSFLWPFYLAAFSTAGGLAYALATSLGGGLVSWLPTEFALGGRVCNNLQVLFVLSAGARLLSALLALRILEPGARSVDSLGALWALVRPEPRRARPVAEAPPLVGEPVRVEG